jgi:aminopeptidase N
MRAPRHLVLAALSLAAAVLASPVLAASADTTTQLPRNVRPSHYDVELTPDATALAFAGKVGIDLEVLEPTPTIVLNALGLTIGAARLQPAAGKESFDTPAVKVDESAQTATLTFPRAVPAGRYRLAMDYTGTIGRQAVGLFALDYDTANGKHRALFTQFENSDARRMFPCWDEPAYKATFTLAATVPKDQLAVSNMPAAQSAPAADGRVHVQFQPSPKMSTYLLFFALGDFERIAAKAGNSEVGIVTRRGVTDQGRFALESAQAILREYDDYFGTPYPLPKLDNVAAPGRAQFFGAMENWGAIFTFERILLLDPSIATEQDRQSVFEVAAHEMAHQWFGDLVTMSWWDDLWLNEGFASWMSTHSTARLHPEWKPALDAVGSRDRAMARDAIATTHPVVQHIETVEQASQAFDAITYSKGQAVIRMLEGFVGEEAWRDGVRRYMKAHAYGNTVSDDLWREIEAAAHQPITAIAHDFTLQPGVPLVVVSDVTCRDGKSIVTLEQREFTRDRPEKKPLAWRVPVVARSSEGGKQGRTVVTDGKGSLTVEGCGSVVVDAGQTGYYRTLYKPQQLAGLIAEFSRLDTVDQLGLLSDAWALGLAGQQSPSTYLDLAEATPVDAEPQVWSAIARTFTNIDEYYRGEPERRAAFRSFAIDRLRPAMKFVGWDKRDGEPDTVAVTRLDLITALSALGDEQLVAEARRRWTAGATNPAALPPALRMKVEEVVARHADVETWERLLSSARTEKTPMIKDMLYTSLGSSEDPALAQRALDLALSSEPPATTSASMITSVSREYPDLAFDFAIAHMPEVAKLVDQSSATRYYAQLADGSADPAMVTKLKSYAEAHLAAGSRRSADTAIAGVEDRVRVRKDRLPAIDAWLAQRQKPVTVTPAT